VHRLTFRVSFTPPFDAEGIFGFLGRRAVPGVESWDGHTYRRTVRLPNGPAIVAVAVPDGGDADGLEAEVDLTDEADAGDAVAVVRRLFDLDADPAAVDPVLAADPFLQPLVAARPGLRVPGAVDPVELLVRAVVGQQVSVAGARTVAGRLAATFGSSLDDPTTGGPVLGGATSPARLFPTAAQLAAADPELLAMPRARGRALVGACRAIAEGAVDLRAEPSGLRAALLDLPGIGPWTADYLLLRAFGQRDVFLAGDLAIRRALERLGVDGRPRPAADRARAWSPWRSYATLHLWRSLEP